jgi:hypothetical protein
MDLMLTASEHQGIFQSAFVTMVWQDNCQNENIVSVFCYNIIIFKTSRRNSAARNRIPAKAQRLYERWVS